MSKRRITFEYSIYALGLAGFLVLTLGIILHISCNGQIPCPWDKWEHLAYYFGHCSMIVAAIVYCIMPFLKR